METKHLYNKDSDELNNIVHRIEILKTGTYFRLHHHKYDGNQEIPKKFSTHFIILFHNNIALSQRMVENHLSYFNLSKDFNIDLFELLKDDVTEPSQTLIDLGKYLETIEIYLKGASDGESNSRQVQENIDLYLEARRLQEQLLHIKI